MTLLDDPVAVAAAPLTPAPAHRRWERHALLALLAATAVLYVWGLGSSGWANNFYAAAVQAGTQDLKAFLFGSLDPGNAITVDKPPASLWVMVLSARLFGFSAFSMLLPEALMGVGAVVLLFVTVRRCSGPAAGLIAGTVLALTPVAALMFRYNQPDALLTLLLTAAAYFMVRAIESGSTRWIALAGTVIGFAFLTKMLQAALVVPGFALVFLLAALGRLSASIAHEIRNPVGAMSHAGQLLAESPGLTEDERRLTQIIRNNAERVSAIIDNVQRLSRRERARLERLPLPAWTEEFQEEFCETMQWPRARLTVGGPDSDVEVRVDPDQLRQILWNLCDNALKHAAYEDPDRGVEIRYGRMVPNARPFLEVADRGPGVAPEHAERIFEPFYSGGRGTGLGLFLARELAQTNGATLLYEPRAGGGSVFRLVFADPRRWEI